MRELGRANNGYQDLEWTAWIVLVPIVVVSELHSMSLRDPALRAAAGSVALAGRAPRGAFRDRDEPLAIGPWSRAEFTSGGMAAMRSADRVEIWRKRQALFALSPTARRRALPRPFLAMRTALRFRKALAVVAAKGTVDRSEVLGKRLNSLDKKLARLMQSSEK